MFRDADVLAAEAAWERGQGFGAKLCIHPDQVDVVAFAPTDDQLAWARRVVPAAAGAYAFKLDGALVDRPVVEHATRLLEGEGR